MLRRGARPLKGEAYRPHLTTRSVLPGMPSSGDGYALFVAAFRNVRFVHLWGTRGPPRLVALSALHLELDWTTNDVCRSLAGSLRSIFPTMGQVPRVVVVPTLQVQLTLP